MATDRDHPDFDASHRVHETRHALYELLRRNAEIARLADLALTSTVVGARGAGVTWDQIGELLGTTRQAAWKKYHRFVVDDEWIDQSGGANGRSESEKETSR